MSTSLLIFLPSLIQLALPEKVLNTTIFQTFENSPDNSKYPFMHKPIFESNNYSGCLRG